MSEDPSTGLDPSEDPGDPKDPSEDLDTGSEDTKDTEDTKVPKQDPELAKVIKARDKVKEQNRILAEKLREAEEKLNPGKADPVAVANRKLVSAEARVILTGKGFTDAADQRAVLEFLKLDDVTVGPDGEVDADAISDQVDTLLAAVRKVAGAGKVPRSPRLDTRDLGGDKGKPADPASARRRAMLQG